MKNLIKFVFDLKKSSFLLVILPFLAINSFNLFNSPFFSFINLSYLFFVLIIFNLSINLILEKIKNHIYIQIFIYPIIFVFFYGFYLSNFFQVFFRENFDISLRGREILVFLLIIFMGIQLKFREIIYIKFLNVFLILFSIITTLTAFLKIHNTNLDSNIFISDFKKINLVNKLEKPVVLIITDECSSPVELFKLYNDSSVFNFSKFLLKNNWLVRNSSRSNEISTIHSISSIFNFNLSKDKNYSGRDNYFLGSNKLLYSSFYDSLYEKKIKFINFGIFRVGNSEPIYNLYKYPENFLQLFLHNTVYNHILYNTGGFKINGFGRNYYPMEDQNKFIVNNMIDSLNHLPGNNFFSYVHLYMPHKPYLFVSEFDKPLTNDTEGYFEYWKFTNNKLEILLSELMMTNKYRIVLSGDHGYRGDSKIYPKNTFMAFYGFDKKDLASVESVQDLGSLIISCY